MQREHDETMYQYAKLANFDVEKTSQFKRMGITDYMKHIEHLSKHEKEVTSKKKTKK